MATILETFGVIRADGTLELEEKLAGEPRRVKVRVEEMAQTESDEDFAKRFAALAATWKEETKFFSRVDKMVNHPAYQEIIAMGERAVPLILAELERNGDHWFIALHRITGADPPIPEGHKGNRVVAPGWVGFDIKGMQAAWLAWGREKGYRWEHVV